MEAENFLARGFATRLKIEAKLHGGRYFSDVADIQMPNRLKGIQLGPEFGTPFLAATQIFDVRPIARKWLSLGHVADQNGRFIEQGVILVTRSGTVGRAICADERINNAIISDDLLQVRPKSELDRGWIYAFLRCATVRQMMSSAQYGHIIKHLEISHLGALPFVDCADGLKEKFANSFDEIIKLRNRSLQSTLGAEQVFQSHFGSFCRKSEGEIGFTVSAVSAFSAERRRLDAQYHSPSVARIVQHLGGRAANWSTIRELGYSAWLPGRFRRIPAEDGVPFLDSSVLFEINPDQRKFIKDSDFGDPYRGRVMAGWLLLARSGQVYGVNGSTMIASCVHEDKVISDHVIRIAPESPKCRVGYLHVAMSHPLLGRPRVKALPYGSSIPEIEVADIVNFSIPRIDRAKEDEIADLAESAASDRDLADAIETQLATEADQIIHSFIQ